MRKAEVTAFLSLIFILFVTFIGGVIESASLQTAKNYRRADMNRAMESVFAEYQTNLLEEYDIFGLEGTYGKGDDSERSLIKRLEYYGASNMDQTIERIEYLTDNGAAPFYQQVAVYMKHKYGADFLKDMVGLTDSWVKQEEDAVKLQEDGKKEQEDLTADLEKAEAEAKEKEEPRMNLQGVTQDDFKGDSEGESILSQINILQGLPILPLVRPGSMQISEKSVNLEDRVSHRDLNQGYGDFSDQEEDGGAISALLFGQYVLDHFHCAVDEGEGAPLDYELEYLIAGQDSDRANLTRVANRLVLFRMVPNLAYLEKNAVKKNEARAMAAVICVACPPAIPVATHVLLGTWAYGEALMDMRSLLKGNKVPFFKNDDTWQLSLNGVLKLATGGEMGDGADADRGLSYQEYLRVLLFLTKKEDLAIRTLDLIEGNICASQESDFFRVDHCVTKLEVKSKCSFRRGINYTFSTYFGYQ